MMSRTAAVIIVLVAIGVLAATMVVAWRPWTDWRAAAFTQGHPNNR
jgi:predicted negative regulator of RcsB-dependent stress response